mmetsp:Transcript_11721/g.21140  ORF Transcript_11721/g.21140 Transcript_11721/m.21140 type:complete len:134 (-) Transcript_11721:227-628(-)|eukprot:CAMPEP_0177768872 /NCGR_PEP_ID=MMETSP0491_2-20121128/9977_1 /TAXON_ID=63592 /ORGANISM="Tetraselmis chuii, Strain PLY429" /LENGTH=133 /DNA_ID=CAMNT_0019285757 /DNA_START=177 /DNA_END=578 /DNA_ORIENTATION=+
MASRASSVCLAFGVCFAFLAFATATKVDIDVTHAVQCDVKAKAGDKVAVHYKGMLTDGKVFDESAKRGQPIEFTLGKGQVIKGWDQGVEGMCVGEKRTLTIPSDLAYGSRGVPQAGIPGGATLVFETELVKIA